MPRGVLRGVLLRGVRRGVVLRPFAMVSREEVDGKAATREKKGPAARGSLCVRFVFQSSSSTKLGAGVYTAAWNAGKQPQGTSHEYHTLRSDLLRTR